MIRTTLARGRFGRGQTLVEFALTLPVILLLLFAAIDTARFVFSAATLQNAVRDATRLAIVNQTPEHILRRVVSESISLGLTPTAPKPVDVTYPDCTAPNIGVGCEIQVSAEYTFHTITPIISTFIPETPMTATTVMPVEYVCPNANVASAQCPRQP